MTTYYGAASLVAKFVSSETPEHTQTTDKHPGILKPNSVNAVRLKNSGVVLDERINLHLL